MDYRYEKLAEEVRQAGGRLELSPASLGSRLGRPVDTDDAYARYALQRRLAPMEVKASFRDDWTITLTTPAALSAGSPGVNPAPDAPTVSATAEETLTSAETVGNGLYAVLVFVCTFFPAIGHQLAPGGEVGDKQDAFFAIYIATFPLSLAATFVFLTFMCKWFDNDKERLGAAGAAIVASAVWGIGFGTSYADMALLSEVRGHALAVAIQVVGLALASYAIFYGWALFIAGWLASFFAAVWIKEKLDEAKVVT